MIACKQILGMLSFYATKVARTRISEGNSSAAAFGLLNVWLRGVPWAQGSRSPRHKWLVGRLGGKKVHRTFFCVHLPVHFSTSPHLPQMLTVFCARDFVLSDYAIMEIIDIILIG